DGVPPEPRAGTATPAAPPPLPKAGPMDEGPPMPPPPAPPPEPKRPKPPMKLQARRVESYMVRYRVPPEANAAKLPAKADEPPQGALKYELDKAHCEGGVKVHQDPAEQERDKRGTDIVGQVLVLDRQPDGSVMTVTGLDDRNPA